MLRLRYGTPNGTRAPQAGLGAFEGRLALVARLRGRRTGGAFLGATETEDLYRPENGLERNADWIEERFTRRLVVRSIA